MGRYMRKGKITGDVAVMEVPQSALGVRTRAKTLALQQNSEVCYLQLRSRRLVKPQFHVPSPVEKQETSKQSNCGANRETQSRRTGSRLRGEKEISKKGETGEEREMRDRCSGAFSSGSTSPMNKGKAGRVRTERVDDSGVEASFGENNLELNGAGRTTRESTPCSVTRGVAGNSTPGSAVRSRHPDPLSWRRVRNLADTTTREMESFFANAERQQQEQFTDKYNFDVLNDLPLPGRYEWVRVEP